ncbi:hypothetical protein N8252_04325 [Ulvibacter sp.]|nr:hypothetical protein [Ulvibacter sp.]
MNKKKLHLFNLHHTSSVGVLMFRVTLMAIMFLIVFPYMGSAQVGIGTEDINTSAILQVETSANDKGILLPRLTKEQRDAINTNAAAASETVPAGLTIYCTDCFGAGKGSIYYYNSVEWRPIDNTGTGKEAMYVLITNRSNNEHLNTLADRLLLIDGSTTLADQANSSELRLNGKIPNPNGNTTENVNIYFSEDIPIGYTYRVYFNVSNPGDLGLQIRHKLNSTWYNNGQHTINTTGDLRGGTLTNVGDDYVYEQTLTYAIDRMRVRSSTFADDVFFLEVKLFDDNGVEIPLVYND